MALIAASGPTPAGRRLCSMLLDQAGAILLAAPAETLHDVGADADAIGRLGSLALLNELCAGCRACPRGDLLAGEAADDGTVPKRWSR